MEIIKISSDTLSYEVVEEVGGIYLTDHGNEKTTIYKITDTKGELIVHAGLLSPHEVETRKL